MIEVGSVQPSSGQIFGEGLSAFDAAEDETASNKRT